MAIVLDQSNTTRDDGNAINYTEVIYFAQSFVPSSSNPISRVIFGLYKAASPTGNLTAEIYSNSAGSPNASMGTSGAVDESTITATYPTVEDVVFDFASPVPVFSGTTYWMVLKDSRTPETTNYIGVHNNSTSVYASGVAKVWTSGGGWTNLGVDRDLYFKEFYLLLSGSFTFL